MFCLESTSSDLADEEGPFCHYGAHNHVSALLTGDVSEWPGTNVVAAAHDGEDPIINVRNGYVS